VRGGARVWTLIRVVWWWDTMPVVDFGFKLRSPWVGWWKRLNFCNVTRQVQCQLELMKF
jgi:hypothetical protein